MIKGLLKVVMFLMVSSEKLVLKYSKIRVDRG